MKENIICFILKSPQLFPNRISAPVGHCTASQTFESDGNLSRSFLVLCRFYKNNCQKPSFAKIWDHQKNVAQTNVEAVHYLDLVVSVVPDRLCILSFPSKLKCPMDKIHCTHCPEPLRHAVREPQLQSTGVLSCVPQSALSNAILTIGSQ